MRQFIDCWNMDHQLPKTQICPLQITLNKSEVKAPIILILLKKFSIPSPTGESPVGDGLEVKNIFAMDEKCPQHGAKLRRTRRIIPAREMTRAAVMHRSALIYCAANWPKTSLQAGEIEAAWLARH